MSPFQTFLTTLTVMNICRLETTRSIRNKLIITTSCVILHVPWTVNYIWIMFHSDPQKFWKFWNGDKFYRNFLGKAPENEVKIPGKDFPKTLVYHAKLSSFLEDCYGKCVQFINGNFQKFKLLIHCSWFYLFINFIHSLNF